VAEEDGAGGTELRHILVLEIQRVIGLEVVEPAVQPGEVTARSGGETVDRDGAGEGDGAHVRDPFGVSSHAREEPVQCYGPVPWR
jgi:hypothetical protein